MYIHTYIYIHNYTVYIAIFLETILVCQPNNSVPNLVDITDGLNVHLVLSM